MVKIVSSFKTSKQDSKYIAYPVQKRDGEQTPKLTCPIWCLYNKIGLTVWKGYNDTDTMNNKKCLTCEFLEKQHALKLSNPSLQYLFRPLHLLNKYLRLMLSDAKLQAKKQKPLQVR